MAEPQTPAAKRRQSAAAKPRQRKPRQSADSQGSQPDSPGNQPPVESPGNESPGNGQSDRPGSPASSPASAAGSSPFVSNAGPTFEPRDGAPAGDDQAVELGFGPQLEPLLWWTPERAEKVLLGQGALTHSLIGVAQEDWRWQPAELDAVAPPMADAMNRVDVLRRFAPYADGIGALLGLGAYFQRSVAERRRVLAQNVPVEEPVTGATADAAAFERTVAPPTEEHLQARRRALDDVIERGRARAATEPDPAAQAVDWRTPDA